MTPPKRTAKPRKVVTDATKAKLPKPTRKRKPVGTMPDEFYHNADVSPPRAIPCGEDVTTVTGTAAYQPEMWYISGDTLRRYLSPMTEAEMDSIRDILPVTEPFPWSVRVLNWLDDAPTKARRKLAAWLRALAGRLDA